MESITVIDGEKKDIRFTFTDNTGIIDLTDCVFKCTINSKTGTVLKIVEDVDFDKSEVNKGIVFCPVNFDFGDGKHEGELKTIFPGLGSDIDKSEIFKVIVTRSLKFEV